MPYFRKDQTILFMTSEFQHRIANEIKNKFPERIISLMENLIREMTSLQQVNFYVGESFNLKIMHENPNRAYITTEMNSKENNNSTTIITDGIVNRKNTSKVDNLEVCETDIYKAEYVALCHNKHDKIASVDIIIEDQNPNKIIGVIEKVKRL